MTKEKNTQRIKFITANAMFAALAFVSVLILKIPGIGGFLSMDFKDVIITIAAMFFGPVSALVLSVLVSVLEYLTVSGTGEYGLIMNILGSVAFSFVASLIYKYKKTLFGAILGLISGCVSMVAIMMIANLLVTPLYMGATTADVAAMIPTLLLPFNAVKGTLNAALTLLLYKPMSTILKRFGFVRSFKEPEKTEHSDKTVDAINKRSIAVFVVSLLIITFSLYVIVIVLGGHVSFFDVFKQNS